eukprot:scaffold592600_cov19-Prasinocladus_malaysianus.AAC.1
MIRTAAAAASTNIQHVSSIASRTRGIAVVLQCKQPCPDIIIVHGDDCLLLWLACFPTDAELHTLYCMM